MWGQLADWITDKMRERGCQLFLAFRSRYGPLSSRSRFGPRLSRIHYSTANASWLFGVDLVRRECAESLWSVSNKLVISAAKWPSSQPCKNIISSYPSRCQSDYLTIMMSTLGGGIGQTHFLSVGCPEYKQPRGQSATGGTLSFFKPFMSESQREYRDLPAPGYPRLRGAIM